MQKCAAAAAAALSNDDAGQKVVKKIAHNPKETSVYRQKQLH
jgi:hypothetical protein